MEYQCEKETTGIYRKISLKNLLDRDDIKNLSVDDLQNVIDTCTALMAFNGPVPEGGRITIWDYYETLAEEFLKDDENDQSFHSWHTCRYGIHYV